MLIYDMGYDIYGMMVIIENSWVCNPDHILDGETVRQINDDIEQVLILAYHTT